MAAIGIMSTSRIRIWSIQSLALNITAWLVANYRTRGKRTLALAKTLKRPLLVLQWKTMANIRVTPGITSPMVWKSAINLYCSATNVLTLSVCKHTRLVVKWAP